MKLPHRPVLIVIAGPNGAGKTSITGRLLQHEWVENCAYINPDNIARDVFGDWNSVDTVLKAAKLAQEQREDCLRKRQNFIFESVLSAHDKIEFIKKAKDNGYFIRLFFIGTDTYSINIKRVMQRVAEGGHDVPINKITSRYSKSIANCAVVASFVNRSYIYDNSIDGAEAKLLFRTVDGKITKTYNTTHAWAQVIAKNLS